MGTNFYLYVPGGRIYGPVHDPHPFLDPGPSSEGTPAFYSLHIGKSSAGWNFGLRLYDKTEYAGLRVDPRGVHPPTHLAEDPPGSLKRWLELFAIERSEIFDEYGDPCAVDEMTTRITKRSHPSGLLSRRDCKQVPGATYDLVRGEFS